LPTGRTLHRIWFYVPDARHTEQQRKRASSEYLRAVSGSIESDITVWIEWNFHMRQDINYSAQDRGNSVLPLNQTDIALTTEDLAIYRRRVIGLVPCSSTMTRYRQCASERGYDGFFWLKQPNFGLDDPAVHQVNSGW
jgi:hypothetical protein